MSSAKIRVSSAFDLWLNRSMNITQVFCRLPSFLLVALILSYSRPAFSQLAPGVRGLATRAPKNMKIDGDISEFQDAFCTPVELDSTPRIPLPARAESLASLLPARWRAD